MKCPICNSEMDERKPGGYFICPSCDYECEAEKSAPGNSQTDTGLYENQYSSYLVKAIISFLIYFILNIVLSTVPLSLAVMVVLYIIATIIQLYFINALVHTLIYKCIDKYHANTVFKIFKISKKGINQNKKMQTRIDALEKELDNLKQQIATLQSQSNQAAADKE